MIIAGFDLETTGFDGSKDHIVEFSFQIWKNGTTTINESHCVNPGVPILNSDIHSITDEMVEDAMDERSALESINSLFNACYHHDIPVVVMNAAFDITFFHNAMVRHYQMNPGFQYMIIDPMVIDKKFDKWRKGGRKLADLCKHYGVELEDGFHNAAFDTEAAIQVALRMNEKFHFLPYNHTESVRKKLHERQAKWYDEQQQGLYEWFVRQENDAALTVRKGWPVSEGLIHDLL